MKTPRSKKKPFIPAAEQVPSVQLERIVGPAIVEDDQGNRKAETVLLRRPIAERGTWDDPDDKNDRSKTPRQVHGLRRPNSLRAIHLRSGQITTKHLSAAEKLLDLAEIANGARPGAERSEIRSSGVPTGASEYQLDALTNCRAALDFVGIRGRLIVEAIVLGGMDVSAYATSRAMSRDVAVGMLVSAMDRLVEFFEPTAWLDDAT